MEVKQSHAGKKARRKRVSGSKGGAFPGVPKEKLWRPLRIQPRPDKSCLVASTWPDVVKTEWRSSVSIAKEHKKIYVSRRPCRSSKDGHGGNAISTFSIKELSGAKQFLVQSNNFTNAR